MKTIFQSNRLLYIKQISDKHLHQTVTLAGWISKIHRVGEQLFGKLRDSTGIVQILIPINNSTLFNLFKKLKKESVVQITGEIFQRRAYNEKYVTEQKAKPHPIHINPGYKFEIHVTTGKILNSALNPPFLIADQTDGQEKLRMQYRYLDLRRPKMQNYLKTRATLQMLIRNFLQEYGFLEINTPVLSFPSDEGARNFLVTSALATRSSTIALPQSPQIYKQLLMTSGFGAYYQLAHCFRDEKLRADRQPEFMQLDLEIAFAESQDVCSLIEKLIAHIWKELRQSDLKIPFARMDYQTAWNTYGTDKPDCRFDLHLQDFSDLFSNVLPPNTVIKAILPSETLTDAKTTLLNQEFNKISADQIFIWQNNQLLQQPTNWSDALLQAVQAYLQNSQIKRFWAVMGPLQTVNALLGHVRKHLAVFLNLVTWKTPDHFVWIVKAPLFILNPQTKQYQPSHHPFCRPLDPKAFATNWQTALGDSYDLVINGLEIASGTSRIYEEKLQRMVFDKMGMSLAKQNTSYGFFLEAMQYGMPPHAGIGVGIERLLQVLIGTSSIRDVMAFPKTSSFDALFLANQLKNNS